MALGAAPASAASVAVVRPAVCTYDSPKTEKSATLTHGTEVRTIQLRYSQTTACAWAREVGGQVGDYMYVWNENTGALQSAFITSGTDNFTNPVNDNGSKSHACMEPVYDRSIKVCTGFY
jgi:hypothetical protein